MWPRDHWWNQRAKKGKVLEANNIKNMIVWNLWSMLKQWKSEDNYYISQVISSVQSFSPVRLFATPWIAAHQASLPNTNSWSLPKPMSIESVMPSSPLILCPPLLHPPSILPNIRIFSKELTLHKRWPNY